MNLYFNTYSLQDSNKSDDDLLYGLALSYKFATLALNKIDIKTKIPTNNIHEIELNKRKISEIIKKHHDEVTRRILINYLLINNIPYKNNLATTSYKINNFDSAFDPVLINQENAYFISLFTDKNWEYESLFFINKSTNQTIKAMNIPNFMNDNLTEHQRLSTIMIDMKDPAYNNNNPLPFRTKNEIAYNTYIRHHMINHKTTPEERKAKVATLSNTIAKINNYNYSRKVSKLNGDNRRIYEGEKYFISTDFSHGTFEVLTKKGEHVNEIDFSGVILEERDGAKKHDIKVK